MPQLVEERRYLIHVEKRWKLLVLPLIALLYFSWVVAIGAGYVQTPNVPLETWVMGGAGLFAFVTFVSLLLLIPRPRRKAKKKKERKAKRKRARDAEDYEPQVLDLAPEEPAYARPASRDEEFRVTKELHKGMRVVEISHPPKSRHQGGIYAKAFLPVEEGWVLRVEELVVAPEEVHLAKSG